jgi:hypothetical protein
MRQGSRSGIVISGPYIGALSCRSEASPLNDFLHGRLALPGIRSFLIGFLVLIAAGVFLTNAGSSGGVSSRTGAGTPTSQGQALVQRFFTLLRNQDRKGLNVLLASNFQSVRANGSVQDKASYLIDPPKVGGFRISKLRGTQGNGVLVVSYRLSVIETIGGVKQPGKPAPRLSVFHREKGAWRLAAHANFGAIKK